MSGIHYFPRYSQPENFVTNNTLLLLVRLHQFNRFKFEKFMEAVCADLEIQLAGSWLQFKQQQTTGKSVVDGFIAQESVKIAVETKLTQIFDSNQLENHLSLFGAGQNKLLILLSPSVNNSFVPQLASLRAIATPRKLEDVAFQEATYELKCAQSRTGSSAPNESSPPSVPCNRITSHGTFLSASTPILRSLRNCTDGRGKMLQLLHVSMAELSMEVGLTADAVSSASLLRKAGFTSGWTGFVNTGRLLGTCLRTGPTAAASRLPQEE